MADKTKKRRINGRDFWRVKEFFKRIEAARKKLQDWRDDVLEEQKFYPDQVNWVTGAVYDWNAEIADGHVVRGRIVDRLPRPALAAHRSLVRDLEKIDEELGAFRDLLAGRLNVFPDDINLKTGEVAESGYEELDEAGLKE